jgi:hypothetical protein
MLIGGGLLAVVVRGVLACLNPSIESGQLRDLRVVEPLGLGAILLGLQDLVVERVCATT